MSLKKMVERHTKEIPNKSDASDNVFCIVSEQ